MAEPRRGPLLFGALLLLYPPVVYFGLQYLQPRLLGLLLALLLIARWWSARDQLRAGALSTLMPVLLAGLACAGAAVVVDSTEALRLLPVAIAVICLFTFAWTLVRPPSMIERFARLSEPDISAAGIAYTRRATMMWCIFFIVNGSVALYTALCATLAVWTLYNGFIAYVFMGLVFVGEYLVRCRVRGREVRG